ncbi:hypothetical protein ACSBR1_029851 [Camellia fascicularis]
MISRYGALYTFSLLDNLIPKWEFFLTMDYPKSELIKFPQYFGYSLDERIKPRYAIVTESGVSGHDLGLGMEQRDICDCLVHKPSNLLVGWGLGDDS